MSDSWSEKDLQLTKDIGRLRKQAKAHRASADHLDVGALWTRGSKTSKKLDKIGKAKRQAAKNMRDYADKLQADLYKMRGRQSTDDSQ